METRITDINHHMQHINQEQVLWQSHEQQEIGSLSNSKGNPLFNCSLMLRRWAAVIEALGCCYCYISINSTD